MKIAKKKIEERKNKLINNLNYYNKNDDSKMDLEKINACSEEVLDKYIEDIIYRDYISIFLSFVLIIPPFVIRIYGINIERINIFNFCSEFLCGADAYLNIIYYISAYIIIILFSIYYRLYIYNRSNFYTIYYSKNNLIGCLLLTSVILLFAFGGFEDTPRIMFGFYGTAILLFMVFRFIFFAFVEYMIIFNQLRSNKNQEMLK